MIWPAQTRKMIFQMKLESHFVTQPAFSWVFAAKALPLVLRKYQIDFSSQHVIYSSQDWGSRDCPCSAHNSLKMIYGFLTQYLNFIFSTNPPTSENICENIIKTNFAS